MEGGKGGGESDIYPVFVSLPARRRRCCLLLVCSLSRWRSRMRARWLGGRGCVVGVRSADESLASRAPGGVGRSAEARRRSPSGAARRQPMGAGWKESGRRPFAPSCHRPQPPPSPSCPFATLPYRTFLWDRWWRGVLLTCLPSPSLPLQMPIPSTAPRTLYDKVRLPSSFPSAGDPSLPSPSFADTPRPPLR